MLRTSEGHKETVRALVIRPDGKMAVSADWGDKTLKLWNLITGKLLNTLGSHRVWKNAVAVNQDGKTAVSSSLDKTLKIWDLGTEIVLNSLEGHRKGVTSVALSPDGKTIVSGSFDKAIIVWDLGSGQKLAAFLSEYIIKSVAFAPCARILIAGEGCGRISSFEIIGLSIGVFMYSGGMKMISFIEEKQLVKKFEHLKLWDVKRKPTSCANCPPAGPYIIYDQFSSPSAEDYLIDANYPIETNL